MLRFWFKLAGHLHTPVKTLQREMDSEEFAYWIAYHSGIEPIGAERTDLAVAINSATIAQCHMKKGRKAKAKDFLLICFEP